MSTYSNRLQPALKNLLQRVVQFFHLRSSCTMHISVDVQRITLNASCMTISGGRTEQLDIFCTSLALRAISQFHRCGTYLVLSWSPSNVCNDVKLIFSANFIIVYCQIAILAACTKYHLCYW